MTSVKGSDAKHITHQAHEVHCETSHLRLMPNYGHECPERLAHLLVATPTPSNQLESLS